MARFRQASRDEGDEPGIDMSPLIDCVFILLIFFIVTTVFVEETGVDVDKPQAASASDLDKTSVLIALTDKGNIMYGGKNIGLAGVQTAVKRAMAGSTEDVPVIIQADREAKSGLLVRVIDEAKLAGAVRVSISTENG